MLEKERAIDFSETDNYEREACRACLPEITEKEQMYKDIKEGQKYNVRFLKSASAHFYNRYDTLISEHFKNLFFSDVEEVFKK